MISFQSHLTFLLADDNEDDRLMFREALDESLVPYKLCEVQDGEELLDYLRHRGQYLTKVSAPRPDLILLDLNMPRKSGYEALAEIKDESALRRIPVIVLSTSRAEEDVALCYELGGSSFVPKPTTFKEMVEMMKTLGKYWAQVCLIPPPQDYHDPSLPSHSSC